MRIAHATSPLADGRDVVIYPAGAGWGFLLPQQHAISIDEDALTVYLAIPDHGSGFHLARLENAEGELRVHLGPPNSNAHAVATGRVPALRAYSFPRIQDELARLKAALVDAGGTAQEADAWAQGASHDSHTARLRARIRDLRRP